MNAVVHLSLHPDEDAKVTPLEVLRDFADATPGWSFLEEDSHHYAKVRNASGVVIRRRINPTTFVDLAFTASLTKNETVDLAVLDPPTSEADLAGDERKQVIETFLDEIRDYLSTRPYHVTLHVNHEQPEQTASQ